MTEINFILLYVESPAKSEAFYRDILSRPAIDSSPSFVMFGMPSGVKLGLWGRDGVAPPSTPPGGSEIAFTLADAAAVDARCADWRARGIRIAQAPQAVDFGYTFTALDPDGHRLRVFTPAAAR